ncbi:hypothetical protein CALCODRAFT_94286 [Calocera cornea HHB12733]|uniref:Uncharacterized protein n=1 Tax=Calocera cornea HHB12733 TaxID=1353952 RepID=A0A165D7Y5_9BASI|nr:hypothetical protein CALCODRAFT_94286 [Calocera cornea HHB12733]
MCHSGTALDLPNNYTWRHVPLRHLWRFNLMEGYLPAAEREKAGKKFLYHIKPTALGDSIRDGPNNRPNPPSRPKGKDKEARGIPRTTSLPVLPSLLHPGYDSLSEATADLQIPPGIALRLERCDSPTGWSVARMRRAFSTWMQRHKRIVSEPTVPSTRSGEPIIMVNGADANEELGGYVQPVMADKRPLSPTDALRVNLDLQYSPYSTSGSLLTPSTPQLTPSSPEGRSIDLEVSSLQGDPTHLSVSFDESSAPPRSASAPPFMPSPKWDKLGEIVCLGASRDSQSSSDDQSLATLLEEVYDTFPDGPTQCQLLLWVTRNSRKGQTPQLSSSRDRMGAWHHKLDV